MVALFLSLGAFPQELREGTSLLFEETEWNFGEIKEADGVVSHEFRYRNTTDEFIAIERIYTSCGCTSGEYSRRPLKPGGEAIFTVTFDPTERGGKVDKSVTIAYNGEERTVLRVKGRVIPRPLSPEELYPYELGGGIRSDSSIKPFGKVSMGRVRSMTIALINTSDKMVEIEIGWEKCSGALEINTPLDMEPGEKALVTLVYAPTKENTKESKLLIDEFRFVIDGTPSEMLFRTSAVVDNS